jgi:hypothetical protein
VTFIKAKDIVGVTKTVVDVDYREGTFGPEVVFELVAADGAAETLTMGRTPKREAVALAVCAALEANPDGTDFTLIEVDAKRSPTGKAYAVKEFNVGGGAGHSALRAQYRASRGIVLPVAPEAVTVVPDEAFD